MTAIETPHWVTLACRLRALFAVLAVFALAGCATKHLMMPTPELYTGPQARPLITETPTADQKPPLELLYMTDRVPATSVDESGPYTADRSRSMAFGTTTVLFGEGLTWDTLLRQSVLAERTDKLELKLGPTKELGRYPRIPYEVTATANGLTRTPEVINAHETAARTLQAEIERRLESSPRKEVVLFVHGYHNTFQDAALTMGELCHFLGREFVCGIFTWPAGGSSGVFFGYNVDYESSVFAIEHLRKAIRTIAATPGVQRIHLIAHSRGSDLLVSALSGLSMEGYTQQSTLPQRYKIGNVVLMAPDMDIDVANAKLFSVLSDPDVPYGPAPKPDMVIPPSPSFRLTIYASPDDKALAASSWLFGSIARLGRLNQDMLTPEQILQARTLGIMDIIQVRGNTGYIGHSYFTSNPEVSADLIAMLRYGLQPNDPGRPLKEIDKPFWRLMDEAETGAEK